jgi:hypothetical protein
VKKYHWQKSQRFLRGGARRKKEDRRNPRNKYYFFLGIINLGTQPAA